jgi:hypothetical protein
MLAVESDCRYLTAGGGSMPEEVTWLPALGHFGLDRLSLGPGRGLVLIGRGRIVSTSSFLSGLTAITTPMGRPQTPERGVAARFYVPKRPTKDR